MTRSSAPPALLPVRTTLAALGAGLVLALVAAPASAHTELTASNPADGATVAPPPTQVVLTFAEAPVALGAQVVVTGPAGPVSLGRAALDGLDVVTDVQPSAPAGRYTVEWRMAPTTGTRSPGRSASPPRPPPAGHRRPRHPARRPPRPRPRRPGASRSSRRGAGSPRA